MCGLVSSLGREESRPHRNKEVEPSIFSLSLLSHAVNTRRMKKQRISLSLHRVDLKGSGLAARSPQSIRFGRDCTCHHAGIGHICRDFVLGCNEIEAHTSGLCDDGVFGQVLPHAQEGRRMRVFSSLFRLISQRSREEVALFQLLVAFEAILAGGRSSLNAHPKNLLYLYPGFGILQDVAFTSTEESYV